MLGSVSLPCPSHPVGAQEIPAGAEGCETLAQASPTAHTAPHRGDSWHPGLLLSLPSCPSRYPRHSTAALPAQGVGDSQVGSQELPTLLRGT